MADGIQDVTKSGKIRLAELKEPALHRERLRAKEQPETLEQTASITGSMPIYREPADDTAERDDDAPAE